MRSTSCKAFTAIEAVISLAIALVVVGTAVQLLAWVSASVRRGENRLDLARRVHRTMLQLRMALADASAYRVDASHARIRFDTPRGAGEVRYRADAQQLVGRVPGWRSREVLLASAVSRVEFQELLPGFLRATIQVGQATFFEEIAVPVLVLPKPGVPWNSAGRNHN